MVEFKNINGYKIKVWIMSITIIALFGICSTLGGMVWSNQSGDIDSIKARVDTNETNFAQYKVEQAKSNGEILTELRNIKEEVKLLRQEFKNSR